MMNRKTKAEPIWKQLIHKTIEGKIKVNGRWLDMVVHANLQPTVTTKVGIVMIELTNPNADSYADTKPELCWTLKTKKLKYYQGREYAGQDGWIEIDDEWLQELVKDPELQKYINRKLVPDLKKI